MISSKYNLSIILSVLLLSCSFFNDSKDTENSPVGTWEVTTLDYYINSDCNGDPDTTFVLNSPESLYLDEFQLELTITQDAYMIAILTVSFVDSHEREEIVSTGIITYEDDQFCVIWDSGNGNEFWINGGGDGCDDCRDYTINGNELEMLANNCPIPDTEINVTCLRYSLVKQ